MRKSELLRRLQGGSHQRGQNLVEFAIVLPVIAVILSAILEFGLAFNVDMALEAASRDGARTGASIGNDGTQGVCPNTTAENTVDPSILSAVQASLTNSGVTLTGVTVTIYLADTNGNPGTSKNVYVYAGAWTLTSGYNWPACGRHDGTFGGGIYDSIGVKVTTTYTSKTGILSFLKGGLPISARAVFPIGPPWSLQ